MNSSNIYETPNQLSWETPFMVPERPLRIPQFIPFLEADRALPFLPSFEEPDMQSKTRPRFNLKLKRMGDVCETNSIGEQTPIIAKQRLEAATNSARPTACSLGLQMAMAA